MAKRPEAKLKLELINVGHGDALILNWQPETGKSSTILVDGGPVGGARRIKETLAGLGASAIDLAVLSHCDADHVDGLLAYVTREGSLPIHYYWGPCVPAFRRHDWLFGPRIARGLDQTETLQKALPSSCNISWPVEGASWTSADGGLSIKVLSPAGRLIERLLVGTDSLSLFLEQPMPVGWLLTGAEEDADVEDPFADLRFAISTGEITPDRVPALPGTPRPAPAADFVQEAATKGVEPEFFGNSVLNDTSIVLLIEARMGVVTRRFLLTGDLENFTYLLARYPMGLACDIVKAPHHGSYSYIDRDVAYDAVWQWMRPRAALVSANGKHKLPRSDFRDAALRYGATLFCTSRRSREIVSGPTSEPCCQVQHACNSQAPVSLTVSAKGIEAEGIACSRGNLSGVMPIIEVRQHVVEPSPILTTIAETEIRKHMDWAVGWLRNTLKERRARPADADLTPISLKMMSQAAVAARRIAAATEIELVLERAARAGKVWLSPHRHRDDRWVWIMPNSDEIGGFTAWIDRFAVIQLAIRTRHAATAPEELLYSADTNWIARRFSERFAFPREMFEGTVWPILVGHLLKKRSIGTRTVPDSVYRSFGASTLLILFKEVDLEAAFTALVNRLALVANTKELSKYISEAARDARNSYGGHPPSWPAEVAEIVTPLWLEKALCPSGLIENRYIDPVSFVGPVEGAEKIREWIDLLPYGPFPLPDAFSRPALASLILSGFEVIRRARSRSPRATK